MKPPKIVQIVFPTDGNMNMMPIVYDRIMFKWGNNNVFDDAANYIRADIADEMLEALEAIVADAEYLALVGDNHARRMAAKAAIAKAKGEAE